MGEVISMSDRQHVKPKSEAHSYKTHRYVLSYMPQAPIIERWSWHVKFTRVYEFAGSCETIEKASKQAKAKIDSMIERTERVG